ncbi:BglG family transcription antiterminator [Virgibacillus salexigens]|uniref:Mannitol operon transcriptional activator n=2 Tax=Virgibacillus massiliensis TaxID=1462526 RepID=A0A024QD92_9BACI|nr:BglG family transcription antiterminator [Virgibacillus massiliensis]CDQ40478.1 Mannitol operon transcriptional activator [Virgibacillus massiliensis]
MVLDKRRAHLLSLLIQEENPIHANALSEIIGVSSRTIYYDLQQVNDWLENQELQPIQSIYGKGYLLVSDVKEELQGQGIHITDEYEYQLAESERQYLLMIKLLIENQPSTMNQFIKLTQMSRSSLVKDLKTVRTYIDDYELTLTFTRPIGYQVNGLEENKRKLLLSILSRTILQSNSVILHKKIYQLLFANSQDKIRDMLLTIIHKAESKLHLTLTDEMEEMLIVQLLIMIKRIKVGQVVEVDSQEKEVLKQSTYFKASQFITNTLAEQFEMPVPFNEVCFLTMNLLGLKVHHDDFRNYTERELFGLQHVVHRMVSDFQKNACVIFNDREGLEKNLISHMKPSYYRLKYGVPYSNHLTENIQKNYTDIFHFTKQVVIHLQYYVGKPIPDDEVAYISLHFGGWLKKEKKQVNMNYKAIIVCENGIGTSNMLKTQLESLVAGLDVVAIQSIREFHINHYNVDVIFSTNYLKEKEIPVIHVAAILTNYEKERILKQINDMFHISSVNKNNTEHLMEVIEEFAVIQDPIGLKTALANLIENRKQLVKEIRKPMLNELLTANTIQFRDRVSNWREAITVAAEPLLHQKSIRSEYIQAMIDNVNELGPYIVMAPNIALPHARPEAGVERLGMSFLRLKEPVYFSDEEKHRAQLIIVLAAIDNETHLTALSQLTELLSEEEKVTHLIKAESIEDVQHMMKQVIKE